MIQLIDTIDKMIKLGDFIQARKVLLALLNNKEKSITSAKNLRSLASLCRRAKLASIGIRILSPIVRPHSRNPKVATPEDLLEYAACLIEIGSKKEALDLLNTLDEKKYPQTQLYKSFIAFSLWDYESSIDLLKPEFKS